METGELILRKDEEKTPVLSVDFEYIPKKVFNFEVADWHTYFVGIFAWVVHNAKRCLSEFLKKVGDNTYDIVLKYKEGWTEAQKKLAKEKVDALTKAKTKVVKNPSRKSGTRRTYQKSGGKVNKGEDVDHIIDLQLGGADDVTNMKGLDQSVNRSLGSQIQDVIHDLPANTEIRNVTIE